MSAKSVKLSCERCRRRKTKCDKEAPCWACKKAGISCTGLQRARLPRGPSGKVKKQKAVLESRVARLEQLLRQVNGQVPSRSEASDVQSLAVSTQSRTASELPHSGKISHFYAKDIWAELSQEVSGLRETLEASDDEDKISDVISGQADENPTRTILFNHPLNTDNEKLQPPPAQVRSVLLSLYQYRMDCLFKITHWPTVVTMIEKQYVDGNGQNFTPSTQALEFAINFLAICSITDQESKEIFFEDRQLLLRRYRIATEMLISKANLLHSPDLTVLQAFAIYLKGLRSCMQYTTFWTLVATAVRVATALGLPAKEAEGWSAYDLEVRQRIWFCIDVLDFQSSADRGSAPLLLLEEISSMPSFVNDSDLPSSAIWPTLLQPDTDMSLMYVYRQATICIKKLFAPPATGNDLQDDWRDKLHTVSMFQESMKQHSSRINDPKNPFRLCAQFSANAIAMDMDLFLRRPPFRVKRSPPPAWDDFSILRRTTEILELNLTKPVNTTFAPWAWFVKPWTRWYILAVLLAELCTPRSGELANRAYKAAQETFPHYAELIADTGLDMLWKPLVKLMRHVDRNYGGTHAKPPVPEQGLIPTDCDFSGQIHATGKSEELETWASSVVLSHDPDAAERVLRLVRAKNETAPAEDSTKVWQNNGMDVQFSASDGLEYGDDKPWLVWDRFLDDVDGFNRCMM